MDIRVAKAIANRYASRARKANRTFLLTVQDVLDLITKDCSHCKCSPYLEYFVGGTMYYYHTIDRIDNTLGYETSNVQALCRSCNTRKGRLTMQRFLETSSCRRNLFAK